MPTLVLIFFTAWQVHNSHMLTWWQHALFISIGFALVMLWKDWEKYKNAAKKGHDSATKEEDLK